MKRIIAVIIFSLVMVLVLCFIIYKPGRVVIPEVIGFTKIANSFYIDEPGKMAEARLLREQALLDIRKEFGDLKKDPRIIFCSLQASFEKFGFKKSAARSVGTYGIVIGPRAWKLYYLKHELIHYWQSENLGTINMYSYPQWLIEGMAYSLSGDPRRPLEEPWDTYRKEFDSWYKKTGKDNLLKGNKLILNSNK